VDQDIWKSRKTARSATWAIQGCLSGYILKDSIPECPYVGSTIRVSNGSVGRLRIVHTWSASATIEAKGTNLLSVMRAFGIRLKVSQRDQSLPTSGDGYFMFLVVVVGGYKVNLVLAITEILSAFLGQSILVRPRRLTWRLFRFPHVTCTWVRLCVTTKRRSEAKLTPYS
jgi:hypothetical protein